MKITLTDPMNIQEYNLNNFYRHLIHLMITSNRIYMDISDIEVNAAGSTIAVEVFKIAQSYGCGTKEVRDRDWAIIKSTVDTLFGSLKQYQTWRVVKYYPHRYSKKQDTDTIEGIKVIIPKGIDVNF
jgi:hypothetical protein